MVASASKQVSAIISTVGRRENESGFDAQREKWEETRTGSDGVGTLGGFSGKHNTVSSIENSVGDIGNFGTGRTGVVLEGNEKSQN